MEYPPPPPVPSDVDPATLAAYPLEELAGAQQAELMAAIKALGDGGDFPEARVQELTQAHERAALPERRRPGNDVSRRRRGCALGPRGGPPHLSFCLWHYTLSTFWS